LLLVLDWVTLQRFSSVFDAHFVQDVPAEGVVDVHAF